MSDIDDELLALAGGGDMSSDEEDGASMNISRPESHSPPPPPPKKEPPPAKAAAPKKAPAKSTKKRPRDDVSEDEGEASSAPSSPTASDQSAPMDESSDDDESGGPAGQDDENQYPVDGLFISHSEKAEIMAMREIEREQILAERREKLDAIRQKRMLRQLVANQDNEKKQKKRKASTGGGPDQDSPRKTSRIRTKVGGTRVGETSAGIDVLRRAREERSSRMQQRELDKDRRKQHPSPSYRRGGSSASPDGDSDVDWASPSKSKAKSRSPEPKEAPPTELRDVERVRLGRSRFAEVCFYPGFDETITGCFCRINVGDDPHTGQSVYRMALIKGFTKGKPYAMLNAQGKSTFVTDQYVKAAHGKAVREWPFIVCSDSGFTESEWERYKKTCVFENIAIPKKPALASKVDDINKLVRRIWTDAELTEKLDRVQRLKNRFNGVDRANLEQSLEAARRAGNADKVERLEDELEKLGTPRLAFRTTLSPAKPSPSAPKGSSQQERLAALNLQNRRRNMEDVRRAQLAESAHRREIESRIERGEEVEEDMSRRLRTRAKFVHNVEDKGKPVSSSSQRGTPGGSGASTPAGAGSLTPRLGAQKEVALLAPHLAKLKEKAHQEAMAKSGFHRPLQDDDIIASLDIDIDVEI